MRRFPFTVVPKSRRYKKVAKMAQQMMEYWWTEELEQKLTEEVREKFRRWALYGEKL